MKNKEPNLECSFCQGSAYYIYRMGEYSAYQCSECNTGFVCPMPDEQTLKKLYEGFIPRLSIAVLPRYLEAGAGLFPQLGLERNNDNMMLDIGGGGGFFIKAFEELGFGRGVYVDLDPVSCRFARDRLGLDRVYNRDALVMKDHLEENFNFIYCRHLIEHLIDPADFIEGIMDLLSPDGRLVLQFPNGDSLEYLAYPHTNFRSRLSRIMRSNNYGKVRTLWTVVSGGILHGLDPPRHLWAITRRGIEQWARTHGLSCTTFARHLGDPSFSPHFQPGSSFGLKFKEFIGQQIFSRIKGGTHLIAILRKK